MDKFWQWIKEKDYGSKDKYSSFVKSGVASVQPTKQMLIGYMFEFISEHTNEFIIMGISKDDHDKDLGDAYIVRVYNWLKNKIEELGE